MNKQEVLNKFIYRKPDESTRPKLEAVNKAVLDVAEAFFSDEQDAHVHARARLVEVIENNVPDGDDRRVALADVQSAGSNLLSLGARVRALQSARMFANSGIVTADRDAESADWCKEGAERAALAQ